MQELQAAMQAVVAGKQATHMDAHSALKYPSTEGLGLQPDVGRAIRKWGKIWEDTVRTGMANAPLSRREELGP